MIRWLRRKQPKLCSVYNCRNAPVGSGSAGDQWLRYCDRHLVQVDYALYLLSDQYAPRLVAILDQGLGIRRGPKA